MKFVIEIVRCDGAQTLVLHRSTLGGVSPKSAKLKASSLLDMWSIKGGTGVRILNEQGEELYAWKIS